MDEMKPFERQLSGVVQRAAPPPRPVDVSSIVDEASTTTPAWRLQSMFSATRFVVAGAIVALFGGVLLTGVLTQSSDDHPLAAGASASASAEATAESTLSGLVPGVDLVTEELEPGVHRVMADGTGHVFDGGFDRVMVGPDDAIWVREHRKPVFDSLWPIGGTEEFSTPQGHPPNDQSALFDIDQEGRIAEAYGGGLIVGRNEGTAGSEYGLPDLWTPDAVAALTDGTVWASWHAANDTVRFGRFDDQGWTEFATPDGIEAVKDLGYAASVSGIASTPDGDVWVGLSDNWGAGFGGGALVRFDGEQWTEVQPFAKDPWTLISDVHGLSVAPDGSLWALVWFLADDEADTIEGSTARTGTAQALLRFDGQVWEAYHPQDLLPSANPSELGLLRAPFVVDEAGRAWASLERLTRDEPTQRKLADHLVSFDGTTTVSHEAVGDVADLAIDDNGTIWAAAGEGLYAIAPEAHAADE